VAALLMLRAAAALGGPAWLSLEEFPTGFEGESFDRESRTQLLALEAVILKVEPDGDDQRRWQRRTAARLDEAWAAAGGTGVLRSLAAAAPIDAERQRFWSEWVSEQLRLARLFPKVSSEVFPLEADDALGFERADRRFALTFDDGPTASGGNSDATVRALHEQGLPATFFVLGEQLRARPDAAALYAGFCVGSHGERHVPHLELERAQTSVEQVRTQLKALPQARLDLFRPPYGQRSAPFASWLAAQHFQVQLWNIDSQDWRHEATPDHVAGRVLALMLVMRRGTILFHDVHPIAPQVLRLLAPRLGDAVRWEGCDRALAAARP
jgi:peptidoglycan/xylan/chitin deacetylase (PgdA/CDA1 family)